jgi:SAM-dependent methyltransferase
MGLVGGQLGIRLLNYASRNGTVSAYPEIATANARKSKLEVLFGPGIWEETLGKDVLDFGCGPGVEAVELALRGARSVVGLELFPKWIRAATALAEARGVADRCRFGKTSADPVDVILSLDSFEHFSDPSAILETMRTLLKPTGCVIASFGPTWYHPLGGHVYSVFPYAHLLFSDFALVRWRSLYYSDGAQTIAQSGLNRITIRGFEKLVAKSPFKFAAFETVPIRRLRPLANRLTREFTTSIVRCKLVPREF